jgi:RimJ/RimL family protein N-acetyltransferase
MIIGKRTRLRGIEREDLPRFVEWLNDPEVIHGLLLGTPLSMAQEQSWFDGMRSRPVEEHPLGIEVQTPTGWQLIGNLGLVHIDWKTRQAEVGIFIGDKGFWNQGYGRDAMVLLLRYAFNNLGLNRVWLRVYETNPCAMHSYLKAGFVLEGRQRQGHFQDGKFIDVLLMSALRCEWQDNEQV